jgi:hypothetical protein
VLEKMAKYTVNKDELISHLFDQISFLIDSAISFDNGCEGESKRLAVAIRILVYHTSTSSALLTQLNKTKILFYDSANSFDPTNTLAVNYLTMIRMSKKEGEKDLKGDYIAPLENRISVNNPEKKIGFDRWWNQNIVIKDNSKNVFKRKDLIITVADKEGGAHVDPKLDQAYANLTRHDPLVWKVYTTEGKRDMGNSVPPSIRQIAHEIIKTLREGTMDLFADKGRVLHKFEEYEKHCLQLSIQRGFKQNDSQATTG